MTEKRSSLGEREAAVSSHQAIHRQRKNDFRVRARQEMSMGLYRKKITLSVPNWEKKEPDAS